MPTSGKSRLAAFLTVGRVFEIVSMLYMIKILNPLQMGSVGLLAVIFISIYSLTNFGFDRYLIRDEGEIPSQHVIDNVWSLQVIRGSIILMFCGIVSFIVPQISDFPDAIFWQMLAIGLALFIYNLANPGLSLFEREGRFQQVGITQGGARVAGSIATMVTVYLFSSPWAFVIGKLVMCSGAMTISYIFTKNIPSFSLERKTVKKIFDFCKHLIIISIVSVIAVQFENYYIGFFFGAEALGFYYTWARIVFLPRELLTQISDKILFAKACAARRDNVENLSLEHILLMGLSFALIVPFYYVIWFHGEWLIGLVAGQEWAQYLWVGRYFVVISMVWMVALLFSPLILAYFPHITSKLRSVEVFLLVILMIYLGDMMEIKGILIASLITVVVQTIVRLYIAYRFILSGVRVSHFLRFSAILSFSTTFVLIAASLNDGSVVNPPGIDEVAVFVFGWICLALYLFFIRKTFKGSCEVEK